MWDNLLIGPRRVAQWRHFKINDKVEPASHAAEIHKLSQISYMRIGRNF